MRFSLVCLLFVASRLSAAYTTGVSGGYISYDSVRQAFLDEEGRERLFHGVNVVYKGAPWVPRLDAFDPFTSFCEQDMDDLQRWGQNIVRLGTMWPGVEPQRGQYNETYLATLKYIVDELSKRGIYTLVDFHQDILSEKFCGEGVPLWAAEPHEDTPSFPSPLNKGQPFAVDENGVPSKADCDKNDWSSYQFSKATARAYQALYDNYDGLRNAFQDYWVKLAQTFKESTGVVGYELFNEPWAGDIFSNPTLLVPGVADSVNLQYFYDVVSSGIRSTDDKHIIFFESTTWDDTVPVGFTHVPGGDGWASKSALSYHFYVPPNLNRESQFAARAKDAARLKCGAMLTEFNFVPDENLTMDLADQYLQSWIGWEFKPFFPITGYGYNIYNQADGKLNTRMVETMTRTYARAIAGRTLSMSFNITTHDFQLRYLQNSSCVLPTEIYVNTEYHYPNGYQVKIHPEDIATVERLTEADHHMLYIHPTNPKAGEILLSMTITRL
jgi:endoglycosylceramidase